MRALIHQPAERQIRKLACSTPSPGWKQNLLSFLLGSTWVAAAVGQSVEILKEQQDGASRNTVSPHREAHPAPGHPDSLGLGEDKPQSKIHSGTAHWEHKSLAPPNGSLHPENII